MFHFLKKNAFLKDLIPSDYVDIHSHLLPGIDDGAVTIEDTLFLIHELQKMGFKQFITTPHIYTTVWDNSTAIIQQKYNETLPDLAKDTSIKFGAEYMIDPYFVNLFQNNPLETLKEKLGDAALYADPSNFEDIAEKMILLFIDETERSDMIESGKLIVNKFKDEKTNAKWWKSVLTQIKKGKK
jgi:tyrosine-protein phosphatase YwqE